jgi:hypothetical protein
MLIKSRWRSDRGEPVFLLPDAHNRLLVVSATSRSFPHPIRAWRIIGPRLGETTRQIEFPPASITSQAQAQDFDKRHLTPIGSFRATESRKFIRERATVREEPPVTADDDEGRLLRRKFCGQVKVVRWLTEQQNIGACDPSTRASAVRRASPPQSAAGFHDAAEPRCSRR